MNERLGIIEERQANRAKYAWKRYVAPQDRVFRDPPLQPEPEVKSQPVVVAPEAINRPTRIRCNIRPRGATNKHAPAMPDHRGRVSDVIFAAAAAFNVSVPDILGTSRCRRFAYPRFAAMHIMVKVLRISLLSIGKVLTRDHTTCLSGVRKAAELRRENIDFAGRSRLVARELRRKWAAQ